jgi:iron complex transport system substrate-binding protein
MGQPRILGAAALVILASCVAFFWVTRNRAGSASISSDRPRIASITPAGTDLVVGIGAAGDLVARSNYDDDREGIADLPRIGDYNSLDWEKIAAVRPTILLLQYAQDRTPADITQRCAAMGIQCLNLKLDTLDEVCAGMRQIGQAIGMQSAADQAVATFRGRLNAVIDRVRGLTPVKTVIVTDDDPISLAGPGEFLDELLTLAGGENAAKSLGKPYPTVDREELLAMAPDVVIRLEPDGDRKPQIVERGDRIWNSLIDLPAVRNHRVYVITDWYCQMPGFRVANLAEKFAELLHPGSAQTKEATRTHIQFFPLPWYAGGGLRWGVFRRLVMKSPHPDPPPEYQGRGISAAIQSALALATEVHP